MHLANCQNLMSPTDSFDEAKLLSEVETERAIVDCTTNLKQAVRAAS